MHYSSYTANFNIMNWNWIRSDSDLHAGTQLYCICPARQLQALLFDMRLAVHRTERQCFCALFKQLCIRHSVCMIMCSKLSATFTLSHAHVRKTTRLSTPAQLQCLHSRAWEPGSLGTRLIFGCAVGAIVIVAILFDSYTKYSTILE